MHSILISNEVLSCRIYLVGVKIAHSLHKLLLMRLYFWELTKSPFIHGWIGLLSLVERRYIGLHVTVCPFVKVALSHLTGNVNTGLFSQLS